MHIKFSCIGGFANLDLNFEIDTDELPKEKYEELQNLMNKLTFLMLPKVNGKNARVRLVFIPAGYSR